GRRPADAPMRPARHVVAAIPGHRHFRFGAGHIFLPALSQGHLILAPVLAIPLSTPLPPFSRRDRCGPGGAAGARGAPEPRAGARSALKARAGALGPPARVFHLAGRGLWPRPPNAAAPPRPQEYPFPLGQGGTGRLGRLALVPL